MFQLLAFRQSECHKKHQSGYSVLFTVRLFLFRVLIRYLWCESLFRLPMWIRLVLFFRHAIETFFIPKFAFEFCKHGSLRLSLSNLHFKDEHHTNLALVPPQIQMRRSKLNMDKRKKQFNSLCIICTTLSCATATKKKNTDTKETKVSRYHLGK